MNDWDKILDDFARKCKGGAPDMTNPNHLALLRESLLKFGWNENATNEFIGNLREGKEIVTEDNSGVFFGYTKKNKKRYFPDAGKLAAAIKRGSVTPAPAGGGSGEDKEGGDKGGGSGEDKEGGDKGGEQTELSEFEEDLKNEQQTTSDLRDKGVAGAGGETASQGESRFCSAVDNLDEDKFKEENKEEIDQKTSDFKNGFTDQFGKKRPNKADEDVLLALGYKKPFSDEAYEYLASREVWAEQELARMTDPANQPNVFTRGTGFDGSENDYMDWMRVAYDGALATQEHLEESRMDTSQPHQTIQSDNKPPRFIDDKVEADLQSKTDEACNLDENSDDCKYYQKELKSFQKFRKYHDTYVVGVDEKGRTFIVSISNKKDGDMNDPQANTTPAARFEVMKEEFGVETAETVTTAIDDGIKQVTSVAEETRKDATQVEIDDDFATLAEAADPKRIKEIDKRAASRKRYKPKPPAEKGRPAKGNEFGCYLEDKGISQEEYDKLSRAEKLKLMQQFMGDDNWHEENGTSVAYDPYSKLFIKVGEAMKGSRGYGEAFWKKNPEAAAARESKGAKQSEEIKRREQEAVKEAHQSVVDKVTEADNEQGYPKDGKNGPHTQAYVATVMEAMHYNTYIDMEDDEDDKILIQMGIRGAKASHIRDCLAEKSGYTWGDREGLKQHLKETCSIEAETGAIIIKSKDGSGEPTRIADDTWRTAGTSQKVASGFGQDMKDCVKGKVDAEVDRTPK